MGEFLTVKHLVELSAADLETLRTMKPMSQERREEESKLPAQGMKIVLGAVVGIWILIAIVGWIWSLVPK